MTDWHFIQSIALASLLAWASGLRLYLVMFVVGLMGYFSYIELPAGLQVLQHPWVIGAAGFMADAGSLLRLPVRASRGGADDVLCAVVTQMS